MNKEYKVLGISSGRPMGNAEVMLREALMEMENSCEMQARIVRLRSLKIKENRGDFSALEDLANGGTGLIDTSDDFEWLKEQILWADAIIFSVPCFTYQTTAEVIILMNRALGLNKEYSEACRKSKKLVGMIAVGGSDTVNFHLPLQDYAMEKLCPGYELVDQFYANWIRGKGYISKQPYHLERSRLLAKRMVNRLNGYRVPPIRTRIMKLNPMERRDDAFVDLEECPVCHSAVVEMDNNPFSYGKFRCAICGATGSVQDHDQKLTYVWDDDTVAHNRYAPEHDSAYIESFKKAHAPVDDSKDLVQDFPILTPANDELGEDPYILAVVAGPHGGTSELLGRKALETACSDGRHKGVIINMLDLKIHFCTGCLVCKTNRRYRGGTDLCILKDDFLWMVDKLVHSAGLIISLDAVNGYTYGTFISAEERFGHLTWTKGTAAGRAPKPFITMISSFDDQVKTATFAARQFAYFYTGENPPFVGEQLFTNVPLAGDNILADKSALGSAAALGAKLRDAVELADKNPAYVKLVEPKKGMCPGCGVDLIELHPDKTVSCALCDAHGEFKHEFGENNIFWDPYSVAHSRLTADGAMLHFKQIHFSQKDDKNVLDDPKVIADELQKYKDYGKLIRP